MLTILFVDDEPNILLGLRRTTRPMRDQWEMQFASSAEEALEIMDSTSFDVVVSDMRMPGLSGSELLGRVRDQSPRTARIILSGYAEEKAILQSTRVAHQFLSKPCDLDRLCSTINGIAHTQASIDSAEIEAAISGVCDLPALPAVFAELTRLLEIEETTTSDIAAVISSDAGLTAEILHMINSAFFNLPRTVDSVQSAVALLGRTVVNSLVLMRSLISSESHPDLSPISNRALEVAAITQMVALDRGMPAKDAGEHFLRGMVHEVGLLVLTQMQVDAGDLDYLIATVDLAADRAHVGMDRFAMGSYLLGLWGFDLGLVEDVAALGLKHAMTPGAKLSPLAIAHEIVLSNLYSLSDLQALEPSQRHNAFDEVELTISTGATTATSEVAA